jgi:lipopolysaccharide transport system ATP-binding protein
MYQVRSLCQKAMWLKNGRMEAFGETEEVVSAYEAYQRKKEGNLRADSSEDVLLEQAPARSDQLSLVRIRNIALLDSSGNSTRKLSSHQDAAVRIDIEAVDSNVPFHAAVVIQRDDGINIFFTTTKQQGLEPVAGLEHVTVLLNLPHFDILSGDYSLYVYVLDDHGIQVIDMAEGVCPFSVRADPSEMGIVALPHKWEII